MFAPLPKRSLAPALLVLILLLLLSEFGPVLAISYDRFSATAANLPRMNSRLMIAIPPDSPTLLIDSLLESEPDLRSIVTEARLGEERFYLFELSPEKSYEELAAVKERLSQRHEISFAQTAYGDADEQLYPTRRVILKFASAVSSARVDYLLDSLGLKVQRKLGWLVNGYVASLARHISDPVSLAQQIERFPEIEFCQPNFVRLLRPNGTMPDDSLFSLQWACHNSGDPVGVPGADTKGLAGWEYARGSQKIKIAVLDEGVDTTHEDLAVKIVDQYDATDFDNEQQPNSWDGHGTACAGVAAAVADNQVGVAGIARQCSVMPIRIAYKASPLPILWVTSDEVIANGIVTAVDRGADVLSLSWGLTYSASIIHAAINYAKTEGRDSLGCVISCSSGNSDNSAILYPAAYTETIAVGATNECDERKSKTTQDGETNWGSNYGSQLSVVAPGVHIWTTDIMGSGGYNTTGNPDYGDPTGNYWSKFTGTSAAAPHVAGLAALILSLDPTLSSDSVEALIENSADDQVGIPSEDTPGWDQYMGYGRINIVQAVKELSTVRYVGGALTESSIWDSSKVHLVESTVTVPNGLALTIDPGTVVKFDQVPLEEGTHERLKLITEGTLRAVGTSARPIIFTSVRDDEYGGDLNDDGSLTQPAPGDWGYVSIANSLSQFTHGRVRYGGVGSFELNSPAAPLYQGKQLLLIDGITTGLSIDSCYFERFRVEGGSENEPTWGINWVTNNQFPSSVSFTGNVVADGDAGINVLVLSPDGTVQCAGNQFQNLTGAALQCSNLTAPSLIRHNNLNNVATGLIVNSSAPGLLIDSNSVRNVTTGGVVIKQVESHLIDNELQQTDSTMGTANGINFANSSKVTIEGNRITGFANGIRSQTGAANGVSNAIIRLNTITNNSYGIYLGSLDTVAADGPNVTINHNDLTVNTEYNLYLGDYRAPDGTEIDARNNWWGSIDQAIIQAGLHDHTVEVSSPRAEILPYRYGSVFSPEGILGFDQPSLSYSLFPDSSTTAQLWLYNQSLEWGVNFSVSGWPSWLTPLPLSGSIPIDDSAVINLEIDASGLDDDLYSETFDIYSSDPLANPRAIPVALQVSSIFLLSPNGGEQFNSGQTQVADWFLIDSTAIDSVVVWFSPDAGGSYARLVSMTSPIFTQSGWIVPVLATDSATLRVEAFWSGGLIGVDESDSLFSVLFGPYVCGQFTNGFTGNTDCDSDGKRNLADLTRLIDRIYLSRTLLCNEGEGNVDGDPLNKLNLSDVTKLIDHIYISKNETAVCN